MTLPILSNNEPTFFLILPSTDVKYSFRRMKVSDEKVLILAKQSEDETEIYSAVLNTVQACSKDPTFDVKKITLFDLEYLFLQIRGQSVSNLITMNYIDNEDNKPYQFNINISDIKIQGIKSKDDFKIAITDSSGLIMKYPTATLYQDKTFLSANDNAYQRLIIRCIDKIYDTDNVYESKDYKDDELISWLDDLDIPVFNKIESFVNSLPVLRHELNYKNSLNNQRTITLATLNDFFMLR
jgi:hypothetical protein